MTVQLKTISFFFVLLFIGGLSLKASSSAESPDDIVVFVNNASLVSSLSAAELKQIFLKKKTSWPGGDKIVSINAVNNSLVREAFRKKVLNMSLQDEATYWENQRIRYQLIAPSEISAGPKAVFKLKAAVAYAFRKDVPKDVVKIVLVIPN